MTESVNGVPSDRLPVLTVRQSYAPSLITPLNLQRSLKVDPTEEIAEY